MVAPIYFLGSLVLAAIVVALVIRRRNYVKARDSNVESLLRKYK